MDIRQKRVLVLIIIILICFSIVLFKAFQLAVIKSPIKKTKTIFKRGIVKDRKGKELALNLETYSIYIHPDLIEIKNDSKFNKLAEILDIDFNELNKKLASKKKFVWLKRKVSLNIKDRVMKLDINGVNYRKEAKRFYPNKKLAAPVLGFVGIDNNGLSGIELSMEKYLKGDFEDADYQPVSDAGSKKIIRGKDVYLTIDKFIQHIVEDELRKAHNQYKSKISMAMVMNARTGEILAMSSLPSYDPNFYNLYSPRKRKNLPINNIFEPGSTFKPFIISAIIQEGLIRENESYTCEGRIHISDKSIRCWDEHGSVKFNDILKYSCNVCIIKVSMKIEKKVLYNYFRNFGFGSYTGIELPGEARGIMRKPSSWTHFSRGSISIGQELAVSGVQLLTAGCALVNEGILMQPKIVHRVLYSDGTVYKEFEPFAVRRVIGKDSSRRIIKHLKLVVSEDGTGEKAAIKNYYIIGKTGTAQVPDLVRGGYYKDKNLVSFLGFLISDFHRIGILIVMENPKADIVTGGDISAPIFKDMMSRIITYLDIPPLNLTGAKGDNFLKTVEKIDVDLSIIPDFTNMTIREVMRMVDGSGIKLDIKGEGTGFVYKQFPLPGTDVSDTTKIIIWVKP